MTSWDTHEEALTEAYHAVYDIKDKLPVGGATFWIAFEAAAKITQLMMAQGFTPPQRFDREGRE